MSFTATLVDPLSGAAPAGWDEFVADQRLLPAWDAELLRIAAGCAQAPSSIVLVREESSSQPVAAFHARHLGLADPRRFVRPGRVPAVSMTVCRIVPNLTAGVSFARTTDHRDRIEAVRVFERAVLRRAGAGGRIVGYDAVPVAQLPELATAGRLRLSRRPSLVLHNDWPDLPSYLATLPRKRRGQLRRIQATVDAGDRARVGLADTIEPEEASWLSEVVRRRHRSTVVPYPPWPARLFERLNQLPGSRFVTYRSPAGRLLAYASVHDDGETLSSGIWGYRSAADGGERDLYFDVYLRQIELMLRLGRRCLVLGRGMEEVKLQFGARPEPRWALVGLARGRAARRARSPGGGVVAGG